MSRSITIEDLYAIQFLSRPRISPDGQRVAFVVTTIDEGKHEYRSSIWVAPTEGGEAMRFTGGTANAHSPCWSPDGRWLAFVTDREGEYASKDAQEQKKQGKGKGQIWLIPGDGGEAHQLTFMPHGASNPTWSPDSKRMVFSAAVGPLDEETEDGKTLPKVRVIDRLLYRLDGVGFIYERRQHLFLVDVSGGEPKQLTDGDWDDKDPTWSPDGTQIAFASSRADGVGFIYERRQHLFLVDVTGGEPKQLTDGDWDDKDPTWSPDGTRIAFTSSRGEDRWQLPCPDVYTLSIEEQGGGQDLDASGEQRATLKAHPSPHNHPRPYGTDVPQTGEERRATLKAPGSEETQREEERRAILKAHPSIQQHQDGASAPPSIQQHQDGASAPTPHPHSPRPYKGELSKEAGELRCMTDGTRSCYSPSWSPGRQNDCISSETKAAFGQP